MWIHPDLPEAFRKQVETLPQIKSAESQAEADLVLDYTHDGIYDVEWVFVLAAPFPVVRDGVTEMELETILAGEGSGDLAGVRVLISTETEAMLKGSGFVLSGSAVHVLPSEELLGTAWREDDTWAILPFEEVEPRWKVLEVEEMSPFREDFDMAVYPLMARIALTGEAKAMDRIMQIWSFCPPGILTGAR